MDRSSSESVDRIVVDVSDHTEVHPKTLPRGTQ